jgi:acetyl esterase/lipase
MNSHRLPVLALFFVMALSGQSEAAGTNADGSINVPAFTLPFSDYGSPESRDDLVRRLTERALPPTKGAAASENEPWVDRALSDQRRRYAVTMTESSLGGVGVRAFVPKAGLSPKNVDRVLINLHGGGFTKNWDAGSQIESIPIAAVGHITVVSVNYRMAPQNHFPDASEDVGNVYRALLKTHKPSQIGIYGCSAGGVLGPQAIAWIQKEGLPTPAALGIFSGSLTRISGDSMFTAGPMSGGAPPRVGPDAVFQAITGGYFSGVDPTNPLMWPAASQGVLAKFPPTMLQTGVRAPEMSATTASHLLLVKAGVDARLYLWEGVGHCFIYSPELPESRDEYEIATKFFDEMMDRAEANSHD